MMDDQDPNGGLPKAPNADEPEYKIGPFHPPIEHRFQKGGASPNPKGRPRKNATLEPDLKKALEDALNLKVTVKQGDHDVRLSKAVLGITKLVNQFALGDRHARRDVMEMAKTLGVDLLAGQRKQIEEAILPNQQALLDEYVARQPRSATAPAKKPEIAPPELRDDDPTYFKTTRPF